jgi:uncharacterized protein (DUF736 family)
VTLEPLNRCPLACYGLCLKPFFGSPYGLPPNKRLTDAATDFFRVSHGGNGAAGNQRRNIMTAIGTLKANRDDTYTLSLQTLTRNLTLELVQIEAKRNPDGPDFRILRDAAEVGAAWKKRSDKGQYISLVLDDPLLPAPLYANSYTREDGITVVLWNRADR